MTFTSPVFLLALFPWAALAVYLLMGRRKRVAVPFVELWKVPIRPRRTTRALHVPPVSVALMLGALLAAVAAAGGPAVQRATEEEGEQGGAATTRPGRNIAIEHVAVRESPAKQMHLRLRNDSDDQRAGLRVACDSRLMLERLLELPAGGTKDYFLDLEGEIGRTVTVELLVEDDQAWDNRRVLLRERAWPRIEMRAAMPEEVQRLVEAYSRQRPPGEGATTVVMVAAEAEAPAGAAVIVAARSAGVAARGEATIAQHPVTQGAEGVGKLMGDAVVAAAPVDAAAWTRVIWIGERPAVLVREAPARQVYVGFHSESLAGAAEFVYLWTNILDWVGGAAGGALVAQAVEAPAGKARPARGARRMETRRLEGAFLMAALSLALMSALTWRRATADNQRPIAAG